MPLRTVLTFVDFSPAGEARIQYAIQLCLRHNAHLVGVFSAPSGWTGNPVESYVRGEGAIRRLIQRNRIEAELASDEASHSFQTTMQREDISFEFRVVRERVETELLMNSLHADLIIGTPAPGGLPGNCSLEAMLLATGVPMIIVPSTWRKASVAERILVGWNASPVARRAITDSLPLLVGAESVCVVVIDADNNARHGEEPGADIALYMSRHGLKVTVNNIRSDGRSIADVLQERQNELTTT